MATALKPCDLSSTITKIGHQHVTYKSNTSTIGKNIFVFHMSIVSGYIVTPRYKEGRAGNPSTGFTPQHVCARFNLGPEFPISYVVVCFAFGEFRYGDR
jgi:hypothetical protein